MVRQPDATMQPTSQVDQLMSKHRVLSFKGLELLQMAVPTAKTIAALFNPANPGNRLIMEGVRTQANTLGMTILAVELKGSAGWLPRRGTLLTT